MQLRSKSLLFATIFLIATVNAYLPAQASRGGIERPANTFTIGFTFKNDGVERVCSGALIRPTVVVTAGHCVYGSSGQLGTDYIFTKPGTPLDAAIDPNARQPKILKIFTKPGFDVNRVGLPDDIAFIQLDTPLASTGFIRVATSAEIANLKDQEIAKGYGFGAVYETGADYSVYPREYHIHWNIPKSNSATTINLNSSEATACRGDSGGPVTTILPNGEEVLLAVISGAARVIQFCGTPGADGEYTMQATNVQGYLSLIAPLLATATPAPTKKIIKINCYKGKIKKVVSGTNPKCPKGYVKR